MLRVFCFGTLGITVEDLYLIDPDPELGGHERGVRVELRLLDPRPWRGSGTASQPIIVDRAVWRADFLESVAGGPGSKDRMHHHPAMADNEPGRRVFDTDLTADPMGWLQDQLDDVAPLLAEAGVDPGAHRPSAAAVSEASPDLVGTVATVLNAVREGVLATAPKKTADTGRA
ncbi:hypothetical protein AGRA3207_001740 [Actinomadura graeca]|uniref:Gamma-glutamylcyclotransferase n=1 Tax=Actinomadura graeca TaxID=2750812 RepID=A0ABX8QQB8_9ACTN|nr:hypothetical protein [Actinomadura graeca]QXJ20942.1 hypothetical protein AGRA3207_001740 [Actinomadura graeca]